MTDRTSKIRLVMVGSAATILSFTPAHAQVYSASGTHECGEAAGGRGGCVVGGLYKDCNEAARDLQKRDCCPHSREGGRSTRFIFGYCIPARP